MDPGMDDVNHPYITDVVTADMPLPTAPGEQVNWYQFKIPIEEYDHIQGNIRDFKSIRFVRMFLNDFSQTDAPVVLRFARLELVRNQWRRYQFSLLDPGEYIPNDVGNETSFNVSSVSFEENSSRQPIPYVLPPGIEREEQLGGGAATNTFLQNEQALSMEICALNDGDARAIYKALNIDLRRYRRMQLDVHAEPLIGTAPPLDELEDGDLTVFMRLGSDFTQNFYEFEMPLLVTDQFGLPTNETDLREEVWKNRLDIELKKFIEAKEARNSAGIDGFTPYVVENPDGSKITIIGNPTLGYVEEVMIGIRNPKDSAGLGDAFCTEVWVNELRPVSYTHLRAHET